MTDYNDPANWDDEPDFSELDAQVRIYELDGEDELFALYYTTDDYDEFYELSYGTVSVKTAIDYYQDIIDSKYPYPKADEYEGVRVGGRSNDNGRMNLLVDSIDPQEILNEPVTPIGKAFVRQVQQEW